MSFNYIRKEVEKYYTQEKKKAVELIKNGFLSTWGEGYSKNDNHLLKFLTPSKIKAYNVGKITRAQAVKIAVARAWADINKTKTEKIVKIEQVEKAEIPHYIKINIEWHKSHTWGYNPSCVINCDTFDYTTGSASGCGYDKESASISEASYNNFAILKILYEMEEKRLKQRKNPQSRTDFIGYGSGYGVLPYFEGGVGASCHISILKKYGYEITEAHGNTYDFYEARLCKKARKQSK